MVLNIVVLNKVHTVGYLHELKNRSDLSTSCLIKILYSIWDCTGWCIIIVKLRCIIKIVPSSKGSRILAFSIVCSGSDR